MTTVVSANLLYTLPAPDARKALDLVLAPQPDLVGLQEWYLPRLPLLRRTGDVRLEPSFGLIRIPAAHAPRYHWVETIADGNVVGARADRFDLVHGRSVLLTGIGRSDRPDRFLDTEPPRLAALGVFRDRVVDRTVALISYHLVPGVEAGGRYRDDRPLIVARHRREVRRIEGLVTELGRAGHTVYAVGDANFHLQRFAGITSSWDGREDDPGTWGRGTRKLDDVHGPGPATEVRLIETPSDHRAVLAVRED
jgi:hypothetical protein